MSSSTDYKPNQLTEGSIKPFILVDYPNTNSQNYPYLSKNKLQSESIQDSMAVKILSLMEYQGLTLFHMYSRPKNDISVFKKSFSSGNVPLTSSQFNGAFGGLYENIQSFVDRKGIIISNLYSNIYILNITSGSYYFAGTESSNYSNWLYVPLNSDTFLFQLDGSSHALILDRFTLNVLATIQTISYTDGTKIVSFNKGLWIIIGNLFYQYDPINLKLDYISDLSSYMSNTTIIYDKTGDVDISPDTFILVSQPNSVGEFPSNVSNIYYRWDFGNSVLGSFTSQIENNLMQAIQEASGTPTSERVIRIPSVSSYIITSLVRDQYDYDTSNKIVSTTWKDYYIKYSMQNSSVLDTQIFIPGKEIGYQQIKDSLYIFTLSNYDNSIVVTTIDPITMKIEYVNKFPSPFSSAGITFDPNASYGFDITISLNGNMLVTINNQYSLLSVFNNGNITWTYLNPQYDSRKRIFMDAESGSVYQIERTQPS